ncbi:MAG: BREX protein BrxB domain-containing protein [Anaerolineae bacterium]
MSEIEGLLEAYARFVRQPWTRDLAGAEKVWFALYEPAQERRLRFRITEFEVATRSAGHGWVHVDLTDSFAQWMAQHEYREAYFQQPKMLSLALAKFETSVIESVRNSLEAPTADENCVVAVSGVASLFGLMQVSELCKAVSSSIRGRLLVFFPGHRDGNIYRLLDARDGWNYLAVPISATDRT